MAQPVVVRGKSVRTRLIAFVLTITIPLVALLIVQSFYANSVVHAQAAESNRNLLTVYLGQIDQNLAYIEYMLTSMVANEVDLLSMESMTDPDAYMLAKIRLFIKLSNDIPLYQSMDAFFICLPDRGDMVPAYNSGLSWAQRERVNARILALLSSPRAPDTDARRWIPMKVDGEYYLVQIAGAGGVYVGAWASADRLLLPLSLIDIGRKGFTLLIAENGEPMSHADRISAEKIDLGRGFQGWYLTGNPTRYLVVGGTSQRGGFSLAALVPDSQITQQLPFLQTLVAVISLAAIGIIPLGLLILRRMVLAPLNHLVQVMEGIRGGDLDLRAEAFGTGDEFAVASDTFNRMIERIQRLKIDVYEEQLEVQRAELRGLELQIKPHFYLNTLNVIYHLAETRNYALIQEMSLSLVRHFRYVFRSGDSLVRLGDELDHVHNYLRIQELRFADGHACTIDAPGGLLETPVPPLMIQTFVENSLKYGVTLDEPVRIDIRACRESRGEQDFLRIDISDSGPGVGPEALEQLRSGSLRPGADGAHVGIWNVRRRLDLLYAGRASIGFFNGDDRGLRVELRIPLDT